MFTFFQSRRRSAALATSGPTIDRRQFLARGAALGAYLATWGCDNTRDIGELDQPDLVATLGPDVVRRLGRRYRESVPRESDARQLTAAIHASRPWTARIGMRHPPIGDQIRDDFDAGRTIVVDGWLLSVTEARQCALYSALES